MAKIPAVWSKGALLVGSVLCGLLLAELLLRLVDYDLNPSSSWRFHPTLGWTIDFRRAAIDELRPDGFRYRLPEGDGGAGSRTLLFLGDSFTVGVDFPYAATLPGRLEDWLNDPGADRWNVVSLAVNDWGTAQQWIALREIGLSLQPDVVIVQTFPFNDFCNNSRILAHTCSLQDIHRPYFKRRAGALVRSDLHPWRSSLRSRFRLFGLIENRADFRIGVLPAHWMPDESDQDVRHREFFRDQARAVGLKYEGSVYAVLPEPFQPPPIKEAWEITRELLAQLQFTAEQTGAPLIGLVIPFLKTFEPEWPSLMEAFPASAEREYGTRRFEEYFRELGVPTVSARRRIEESDMSYTDYFISPTDGHLSPFGHAECAAWLAEVLRDLLDLPGEPPSIHLRRIDLLEEVSPAELVLSGLGPRTTRSGRFQRDGLGPASTLTFRNASAQSARLDLDVASLVPGQGLEISVNGYSVSQSPRLDEAEVWRTEVTVPLRAGRNVVAVRYQEWNGREEIFFPADQRPLAGRFERLTIDPTAPGEMAE
jgi:hypothetical protein